MNKKLKNIKAILMISILFSGIFVAMVPAASAGPIKIDSVIQITASSSALQKPVKPITGDRRVPINITYSTSGFWASAAESRLAGQNVEIYLSAKSSAEWFTAEFQTNVVQPKALLNGDTVTAVLKIDVNENAPAFGSGKCTIVAELKEKNIGVAYNIKPMTITQDFTFDPGYLSSISIVSDSHYKQVSPHDTADFDIQLKNLGNGETEVTLKVVDKPEGWVVTVPTTVTLGSKQYDGESTASVAVNVKPPQTFGYHYDVGTIELEVTPTYAREPGNPEWTGKTYSEQFQIESRGFAVGSGLELAIVVTLIIIAIAAVLLYFLYFKKKNII
ncbi:MAG: hypothetical protein V5A64_00880 [Candidatus Thermoplasmatota archaeon]